MASGLPAGSPAPLYIAPSNWVGVGGERTGLTVAECEQAALAVTPAADSRAGAMNAALDEIIGGACLHQNVQSALTERAM